jgi:para-nitrobenzyl esterase
MLASNGRIFGPGANNARPVDRDRIRHASGSEDCLARPNIWQPTDRHPIITDTATTKKRPVIFFVHGGSNITGYTADPVYDGAEPAYRGRVVVTANYRLGIFGFFNQPGSRPGSAAGFGQLACRPDEGAGFVESIRIRGDPHNVTLM